MADADSTPTFFPPADTSACPDDDALKAFVDQDNIDPDADRVDLDDPAAGEMALASAMITEHLDGCTTCSTRVEALRFKVTHPKLFPIDGPDPDASNDALDHAEPLHEHLEAFGEDPDEPAGPTPVGLW